MLVQKDYEDLLRSFNDNKVRYCIIGAFVMAFHGKPRYTKDIDILIEPTIKNGTRIVKALSDFGFSKMNITADDFAKKGQVIQLGYEPVRIDIATSITGCAFGEVWRTKKAGKYGSQRVYFIGLKELIKNKKKTKRLQDKADLEVLQS